MKLGDNVSVGLYVESDTLLPDEITTRIGLTPTRSHTKGSLNRVNKPMPSNMWGVAYSQEADPGGATAHEMLPSCIELLLAKVEPHKAAILTLSSFGKSVIGINIVAKSVPGFELSPAQLALIGSMGVGLDYSATLYE